VQTDILHLLYTYLVLKIKVGVRVES